ncbi:MAG: DNA internalization-related competence protein ComEC/Rec2, partial [Myxococcales bacterium]|nr:DNA internalization-related competence protein ComEC/Rec2 [Myxococcales bacterium]
RHMGELVEPTHEGENDDSLVVAVERAGRRVLFLGDLEHAGEAALLATIPAEQLVADVVKVAHHGSRTSSTPGFVAATRPRIAVISCGLNNRFGFPSPEVVERWRAAGAEIARTDTDGAITVTIHDDGRLTLDRFAR